MSVPLMLARACPAHVHAILHFWITNMHITRSCVKDLKDQFSVSAVLE
jgi:hypothetical protein